MQVEKAGHYPTVDTEDLFARQVSTKVRTSIQFESRWFCYAQPILSMLQLDSNGRKGEC
jgi:hypothetical protein